MVGPTLVISMDVRNPLLSERDGNVFQAVFNWQDDHKLSETHYSLKEMETCVEPACLKFLHHIVRNPLLSERDGNFRGNSYWVSLNIPGQKPTTLWKRWKPCKSSPININWNISQKPTTLWKRWKLEALNAWRVYDELRSETHYSLKEMETPTAFNGIPSTVTSQKPTTLWKRWKLRQLEFFNNPHLIKSETHYSLKEMETLG